MKDDKYLFYMTYGQAVFMVLFFGLALIITATLVPRRGEEVIAENEVVQEIRESDYWVNSETAQKTYNMYISPPDTVFALERYVADTTGGEVAFESQQVFHSANTKVDGEMVMMSARYVEEQGVWLSRVTVYHTPGGMPEYSEEREIVPGEMAYMLGGTLFVSKDTLREFRNWCETRSFD